MKEDTGEIFTLDEVAAYLKVGKRTVYRLAAAKRALLETSLTVVASEPA
jgi:AcrR family transcriptional regulator